MTSYDTLTAVGARQTVADNVYQQLKILLLDGEVHPGERMTLRTLAQTLNTSPMPVREAASRLVSEGAWLSSPNKGFFVPEPNIVQLREIVTIRCHVEGLAALHAAINITAEELVTLESHVLEFDRLGSAEEKDVRRIIQANRKLHFLVYNASRMPMLVKIIESIWLKVAPIFAQTMHKQGRELQAWSSFSHHRNLLHAIQHQDAIRAQQAIVADIADAAAYIETVSYH
jgi:DNA-binding GntR family transcriptional regulator